MTLFSFARRWLLTLLAFFGFPLAAHAAIPAAPSGCIVQALSATASAATIKITWNDNSDDETVWKIYRSADSGASYSLFVTTASATTSSTGVEFLTWTSAALNSEYRFAVIASNASGNSPPSNIATVGTFDLIFPINFNVTVVDPFNVAVSWEEGSTSESGYVVERRIGSGPWEAIVIADPNILSFGPVNLIAPLQSYSFRARAFKGSPPTTPDTPPDANVSDYSNTASIASGAYTLTATPVPGLPVVNLSWPNILNESGYRVFYKQADEMEYSVLGEVVANVSGVQVSTPDIERGLSYVFVVQPFAGNATIGSSNEAAVSVDGINSTPGSSGTPGSLFFHAFTHASGSAVVSQTLAGVPPELTFDSASGILSGVCPPLGNYTLNYTLNLANGAIFNQVFSLRVRPAAGPPVVAAAIPAWDALAGATRDTPLAGTFTDPEAESAVRVNTTLGNMDFILFDTATPATVANFMNYVNAGKYTDVAFHRSVPGFVVQSGGFKGAGVGSDFARVVTDPPVVNEPGIANERGTVSMAKVSGNPNSATSQFFVSVGDNPGSYPDGLNYQNGGFTVFGRVAGNGMAVADAINFLPTESYGLFLNGSASPTVFENFPMNDSTPPVPMDQTKLVRINSVSTIPTIRTSITGNMDPSVATASIVGGQLRLAGLAGGQTTITVTATDLDDLTVSQDVVVTLSDTYGTWASRGSFPGGLSGALLNPDSDTLTNLQEYAFLGDPAIASQSPLPLAGKTGVSPAPQYLTLTFPVRKFTTGLSYVVEANHSLSGAWTTVWSSSNGFSHAQVVAAADQADRTVVTIKDTAAISGQSKRFLRTRVIQD